MDKVNKGCLSSAIRTNELGMFGADFYRYLNDVIDKEIKVNKETVFCKLSSLALPDEYELGLKIADRHTDDIGDISEFFICDKKGHTDKDLVKYLRANPSEMAAWQIYLLMKSSTVMPVFWHGGYILRDFIFCIGDLKNIESSKKEDLSAFYEDARILPSVTFRKMDDSGKYTASVYCCYWNEWEGLVQEVTDINFRGDKVISCERRDKTVLYEYECGILY